MENTLFNIEHYESHVIIIEADNVIPIEDYTKQKKREERRKTELLIDGILQKVGGLILIMLAFFVAKIIGGFDLASGSFIVMGIWLILSKKHIF